LERFTTVDEYATLAELARIRSEWEGRWAA
jgi:hypothetical protein